MKSVCNHPGCQKLVEWPERFCEKHKALREKQKEEREKQRADKRVGSFFYGRKWKNARRGFLRDHPVCAMCGRLATDVDHIKPHRGDMDLFWDRSNWQSLCHECHSKKTASEDGGFGNKTK